MRKAVEYTRKGLGARELWAGGGRTEAGGDGEHTGTLQVTASCAHFTLGFITSVRTSQEMVGTTRYLK